MVSGFEKRMLSGMFGLLSVDCAKVGEIVPATASVTARRDAPTRNVGRELLQVFGGKCVSHSQYIRARARE